MSAVLNENRRPSVTDRGHVSRMVVPRHSKRARLLSWRHTLLRQADEAERRFLSTAMICLAVLAMAPLLLLHLLTFLYPDLLWIPVAP